MLNGEFVLDINHERYVEGISRVLHKFYHYPQGTRFIRLRKNGQGEVVGWDVDNEECRFNESESYLRADEAVIRHRNGWCFNHFSYHFQPKEDEGRRNLDKTILLALERASENDISKIVVFTADGEGVFALHKKMNEMKMNEMNIIAVTFPQKRPFYTEEKEGKVEKFFPKTSEVQVKEAISNLGVPLVQGVMPFEEVIVPGARQSNTRIIKETLGLFSGGMQLCVQAVLMATDAGYVDIGEAVVAVTADTAVVARGALSEYLFHPHEGLSIVEIICKPSKRTI